MTSCQVASLYKSVVVDKPTTHSKRKAADARAAVDILRAALAPKPKPTTQR